MPLTRDMTHFRCTPHGQAGAKKSRDSYCEAFGEREGIIEDDWHLQKARQTSRVTPDMYTIERISHVSALWLKQSEQCTSYPRAKIEHVSVTVSDAGAPSKRK